MRIDKLFRIIGFALLGILACGTVAVFMVWIQTKFFTPPKQDYTALDSIMKYELKLIDKRHKETEEILKTSLSKIGKIDSSLHKNQKQLTYEIKWLRSASDSTKLSIADSMLRAKGIRK